MELLLINNIGFAMIRRIMPFVCDNCKKIFVGLDIEYRATVFSACFMS